MDKVRVAAKLRRLLQQRIALLIECEADDLKTLRLGPCLHLLFALVGHREEIGGLTTTFKCITDLVGGDLVWADVEPKEEEEKPAVVIN